MPQFPPATLTHCPGAISLDGRNKAQRSYCGHCPPASPGSPGGGDTSPGLHPSTTPGGTQGSRPRKTLSGLSPKDWCFKKVSQEEDVQPRLRPQPQRAPFLLPHKSPIPLWPMWVPLLWTLPKMPCMSFWKHAPTEEPSRLVRLGQNRARRVGSFSGQRRPGECWCRGATPRSASPGLGTPFCICANWLAEPKLRTWMLQFHFVSLTHLVAFTSRGRQDYACRCVCAHTLTQAADTHTQQPRPGVPHTALLGVVECGGLESSGWLRPSLRWFQPWLSAC